METFISIMVYATLVLAGMVAVGGLFVLLGTAIARETYDPDAEHH